MKSDLEELENEIRQKESISRRSHKKMRMSGRSVFNLQRIIKKKAKKDEEKNQ